MAKTKEQKGAKPAGGKGGPPATPTVRTATAGPTEPAPKAREGKPRLQAHYESVVHAKIAKEKSS